MRNWLLTLFALMLLWHCGGDEPTKPAQPGTIKGTVYNSQSGEAIIKALVITSPPTSAVTTDSLGFYQIDEVSAGKYEVTAWKAGFDSASVVILVAAGKTTTADVALLPDSTAR